MIAKKTCALGLSLLILTMLVPAAASACTGNTNPNLLHNANFEAGSGFTIPNWTVAVTPDSSVTVSTGQHQSGAQSLAVGTVGHENRIYQKIGGTVAGTVYTACFYLKNGNSIVATGSARFQAEWNNQPKVDLINSGSMSNWQYFEFTFVATGNDVLGFEERNDPSDYYVDNAAVQECISCTFYPNQLGTKEAAR